LNYELLGTLSIFSLRLALSIVHG